MCHDPKFRPKIEIVTQKQALLHRTQSNKLTSHAPIDRVGGAVDNTRHMNITNPENIRSAQRNPSVKQPEFAGFLVTQHHFTPRQRGGHPNRPPDNRRQRMGDVHGKRGPMQFIRQIQLRDRKHSPARGRKSRQLALVTPVLRTVGTVMVALIIQAKTMLGIDKIQRHHSTVRKIHAGNHAIRPHDRQSVADEHKPHLSLFGGIAPRLHKLQRIQTLTPVWDVLSFGKLDQPLTSGEPMANQRLRNHDDILDAPPAGSQSPRRNRHKHWNSGDFAHMPRGQAFPDMHSHIGRQGRVFLHAAAEGR